VSWVVKPSSRAMDRKQFVGYWIGWPYPFCDARAEQQLHEDGRFEAKIIADERLKSNCSTTGEWDLIDEAIQWTYESAKKVRKPRRPQLDKVLALEENRFVILEGKGPAKTEYWRGVPCDDTSTNFGIDEVRPFLDRLVKFIDAGFGAGEIASVMAKIQKLEVHERSQMVFSITLQGVVSPFYLGVFMDDVEAPDICFSGPADFVKHIDDEIKNFDRSLEG
jgi:hypothetical protein